MAESEVRISAEGLDQLAQIVIMRAKQGHDRQNTYIGHQGKTVAFLKRRAEAQYNREYLKEDAAQIQAAFGFVPTRYFGVTQQKVNATFNWKLDLVISQLDAMAVCMPTPEPDLDEATRERIRNELHQKLQQTATNAGLTDLTLLLDDKGNFDKRVHYFLQSEALALKEYEQAKLVSAAKRGAGRMQRRMHDIIMEGDFRQAYFKMSFDQALHGVGYIRFPSWEARPRLKHSGKNGIIQKWERVPVFKHVPVHNFFPLDDGPDLQSNTGNTEITWITQAQLVACTKNKDYNAQAIAEILEEYATKDRNWVWTNQTTRNNEDHVTLWGVDETIQLMIHEGYFSGRELREYGISTGVADTEYVNAKVEVCGCRTIRASLIKAPKGETRSFFMAPFMKTGPNIFDYVGLAGLLWDTEQRINRLFHTFEYNIDWSSRPPNLYNEAAFRNPEDAHNIVPGQNYPVEDRFGATGSMPEPLRTIKGPTAQYQLIMAQIQTLFRFADEDCGIPAFAYSGQDMGRTSLGEYSQRMTNALRSVKGMALQEDVHFIEPAFENLFRHLIINEPELREEMDVNLEVRGLTGLLKEDIIAQRQQQVLPMLLNLQQVMPETNIALKYAVRQALEQAGIPVEALGMDDPVLDNAIAIAAGQPVTGVIPASQQVPELDGRSRVNPSNVAQPNGISSMNQTSPLSA